LNNLNNTCTQILDFTHIFDYVQSPIYYDAGHTDSFGNKLISENIFSHILSIVSANNENIKIKNYSETSKNLHPVVFAHSSDLSGKTFDNLNLSNAVFYETNLSYSSFKNTILDGAVFKGANLTGVDLSEIDLSGKDLTGTILAHADLTDAILTGADLTDVILTGADLTNTTMPDGYD